ncbi:hypothetical protein [Sphingobacterium tabacisoli]|uniref:DUF4876 domain-containing protein n=1 Tax=Sphingobacterium tabacisoli TaxID=2044855 RepID=A0ABW5L5N2_9SPHI|nr:hypothetical protein [Sphingobacterium tabacisoli]
MRMKINYIRTSLCCILLSLVFVACNKEDMIREKAMHIIINGYNGDVNELEVTIDTTVYDKATKNGKFILQPESVIGFNVVYTYNPVVREQILRIKNTGTGKVMYTGALPNEGTKAIFNFIYLDGKELTLEIPQPNPSTNKLGFYLNNTGDNTPIDIFLYRKDESNGAEYRAYLAKNISPNSWIYTDYIAAPAFDDKNKVNKSTICFTKAGTTDEWAIEGDKNQSEVSAFGKGLPLAGEKGLVQPYFFTPNAGVLTHSSLFFYPDRSN